MTFVRTSVIFGIIGVSVALNLFLAGGLLGRQFHKPNPAHDFETRMSGVLVGLPDNDQAVANEILGRHREELLTKWRAQRNAIQRSVQSLHATPFDPADAHTNFAASNQKAMELRSAIQDTMIEIAGKISDEGREHLHFGPGM